MAYRAIKQNSSIITKIIDNSFFAPIFILLLIAFNITLSTTILLKQSLRLDEAQSLWQSSHSLSGILKVIAEDVHVPLYHFLLHFWQLFLGNGVDTGRIISLIFFVATTPLLYWLAKTTFNKKIALMSVFLFSISPFMNWYGNELRMYTMLTFFTVANQLFFIRIMKYDKNYDWYGYIITSIFGMFTHYFFAFNLLTQIIFFVTNKRLFRRDSFKKFIASAIILILAFLPWLIYVYKLGGSSNTQPMLIKPSSVDFFNTYSRFIFGFQDDSINTLILSMWPLLVLFGFLTLKKTKKISPMIFFFILAALFPIISAFLLSISLRPLFVTRYLILSLPALYILISVFLNVFSKKISAILHFLLIGGMIATLAIEILSTTTPVKEDYKDVAAYLQANTKIQDVIIVSAPFTIYPIEYYYDGQTSIHTLPIWHREITGSIPPFIEEELPNEVQTIQEKHQNAWLILSYDQGYEKKIKDYFDNHYAILTKKSFSPGLNLYEYKLRYDTDGK